MTRYRKQRVSEMLREFLSAELLRSHNESLRNVSISTVEVSPDLKMAKIYWVPSQAAFISSVPEGEAAPEKKKSPEAVKKIISEALKDSKGGLRSAIAHGLTLKFVPDLEFRYDDSIERGSRIDELLSKAGFEQKV